MKEAERRTLEFETKQRYLIYDEQSGELVHTHEITREAGSYEETPDSETADIILQLAAQDFEGVNLRIMDAPQDFESRPGVVYRVDPKSGELTQTILGTTSFRLFRRSDSNE